MPTIFLNSKSIHAEPGESLLEALRRNGIYTASPCGGRGTCGKCAVLLPSAEPSERDRRLLSSAQIEGGLRLACGVAVNGDITLALPPSPEDGAQIESKGYSPRPGAASPLKAHDIKMPTPSLADARDDAARLRGELNMPELEVPLRLMRRLPGLLAQNGYAATAFTLKNRLTELLPPGGADSFGLAVDIGTSTVVCYLVDLSNGEVVDTAAAMNAQKSYGADVISRIQYAMDNTGGLEILQKAIIGQINGLLAGMPGRCEIKKDDIRLAVIAGNTVMQHLALGLHPGRIAAAPFISVNNDICNCMGGEFGLMTENAPVIVLPCMGAYVGGDITAAIAASGMAERDGASMLIDVGTNGEICLGGRDGILCCATAAGPAFEGAGIRFGMPSLAGAICGVTEKNGSLTYSVIGGAEPAGICGSGLIDLAALLLDKGLIDETGLFDEDCEAFGGVSEKDGIYGFWLTDKIALTDRDVRELQLAKAAIAAGIDTLLHEAGITCGGITALYLSGGFGSRMNAVSAARIGLFPKELLPKAVTIGNGAGTGAVMAMADDKVLPQMIETVKKARYVELSSNQYFQGSYVDHMTFENQ